MSARDSLTTKGPCFKCGEEGHMWTDCPNDSNGEVEGIPKSALRGNYGNGESNAPRGACFKCGQEGH
jgi:hypothetical protein